MSAVWMLRDGNINVGVLACHRFTSGVAKHSHQAEEIFVISMTIAVRCDICRCFDPQSLRVIGIAVGSTAVSDKSFLGDKLCMTFDNTRKTLEDNPLSQLQEETTGTTAQACAQAGEISCKSWHSSSSLQSRRPPQLPPSQLSRGAGSNHSPSAFRRNRVCLRCIEGKVGAVRKWRHNDHPSHLGTIQTCHIHCCWQRRWADSLCRTDAAAARLVWCGGAVHLGGSS